MVLRATAVRIRRICAAKEEWQKNAKMEQLANMDWQKALGKWQKHKMEQLAYTGLKIPSKTRSKYVLRIYNISSATMSCQ